MVQGSTSTSSTHSCVVASLLPFSVGHGAWLLIFLSVKSVERPIYLQSSDSNQLRVSIVTKTQKCVVSVKHTASMRIGANKID